MMKIATLPDTLLHVFAQTDAAPAAGGGFPPMMLIGYGLLFVALYFFMIAPQRKKQKEHQKMLSELDTGDQIVTSGGIYGEITNKKDDRFVIRIADNVKIEVAKAFVQAVVKKSGEDKK